MDYIGRKGCGCVVVWLSEEMPKRELARELGKLVRDGLSVERMSTEKVRRLFRICPHEKEAKVDGRVRLL